MSAGKIVPARKSEESNPIQNEPTNDLHLGSARRGGRSRTTSRKLALNGQIVTAAV